MLFYLVVYILAQCTQGCFNGGYCGAPDSCVCSAGWTGENCTEGLLILKNIRNYSIGHVTQWHNYTRA